MDLAPGGAAFAGGGGMWRAAAQASARMSSVPQIQAACSWVISSGAAERKIGPVEGPAPVMADFASFRAVSDPGHRHAYE